VIPVYEPAAIMIPDIVSAVDFEFIDSFVTNFDDLA